MKTDARDKIALELTAERDELNFRAGEVERRAATTVDREEKARLASAAGELRDRAREVNRRLDELADSEIHDDNRGGIER